MTDPILRDQTVCVTGGGGFIGSHLADALVEHNEVIVLDDFSNGNPENVPAGATMVKGDVRDDAILTDAVADADVVFHQAAQISVDRSVGNPVASHEVNVDATLSLLELAREYDCRAVLASSCAIYGHHESVAIPEVTLLTPTSPYGIEKLSIDHYARRYHDLYGLETVALRYFNVYGSRQAASDDSGVISTFAGQATSGDPITVHGDGSQTRDFVHISDVVRANLLAATTDQVGEAFNVGTGEAASIRELAEAIRRMTDSDSAIVYIDHPREADINHSRADIMKASEYLGFEATVDLEAGLSKLLRGSSL